MAVYLFCKSCKSTYGLKLRECPKCGTPTAARDKVYRVSVMVNGKRVTRTVPNSIDRAREIEAKLKVELVSDEYYDRREKIPTFAEAWESYSTLHKTVKSWKQDKSRYETTLKDRIGKKPLDQISPMDVHRLISDMKNATTKRKAAYSPKSIKNTHELMSRIFNHAINVMSCKAENPCSKAKPKRSISEVTNLLDEEKLRSLLNTLDRHEDRPTANIVKLLLFTGMRRGEAFSLTWQRVDLKSKWIYLDDPKSGEPEKIPLNELAYLVLKDQERFRPEKTDLVFPNRKDGKRTDIKRPWAKIKKDAGLPAAFRLHDLRHQYASMLAASGEVDLYTIQKLLRHRSPTMTQRYAHLVDEARKRGTRTLEKIILDAQTGEDEIKSQTGGIA